MTDMRNWTAEQLREYLARRQGGAEVAPKPRAKYGNKKTTIDGRTFDSKLEAGRYVALKRMQEGGLISGLQCQVSFSLVVNEQLVCRYVADFTYKDCHGKPIVEDAKGVRTRDYLLKKKLMRACLGVDIVEYRQERRRARKP